MTRDNPVVVESLKIEIEQLELEMGQAQASPVLRLAIQATINSWLDYHYSLTYSVGFEGNKTEDDRRQKRIDRSLQRYLNCLECVSKELRRGSELLGVVGVLGEGKGLCCTLCTSGAAVETVAVGSLLSTSWGKNTQPNINHENTGGFVTNTYPILAGVGRCFHLAQSRNLAQPAGLMPGGIFHSANSIDQSVVPHDFREFGIFTIMSFVFQPGQLYMVILCGWMNRQQQEVIEYLQTENRVLKEKLGAKRIMLNDDQRRRLGVKGKILGRKLLEEFGTRFAPDTILRWHRQLVAQKWDYSDRKQKEPGRPRIRQVIVDLTLQFAKENPTWGFDRIQGELSKVGYVICDTTVSNILKEHGIEPAPTRKRTGSWATFLKSHWDVIAAIDFISVEVWTKGGLVTFYLLFVMERKNVAYISPAARQVLTKPG